VFHDSQQVINVGSAIAVVIDGAWTAAWDPPGGEHGQHVVDTYGAVIVDVARQAVMPHKEGRWSGTDM